jgi:hypothetical protein
MSPRKQLLRPLQLAHLPVLNVSIHYSNQFQHPVCTRAGIGALVPNRRNDLAQLGLRAMLAGTTVNLMSASIVSMLLK